MSLLEHLRGIWSGPLTSSSPELARLWGAPSTSTGMAVSESTALQISTFWSAVQLIAGDVASLPLILYKRLPNGGKERMTWHPLYRVLHDIGNPESGAMTVRETLMMQTLVTGNGYAEIVRNGMGQVSALWPMASNRVQPMRDRRGLLLYQVSRTDGGYDTLESADIFHLHGLSWDGTVGLSVVANARESLGLAMAAERFGGSFFANSCQFGGFLSHSGRLSELARNNLRQAVESQHRGVDRAHRLMVLEEDIKFQAIGLSPEDSQFLESRQFQVAEIARWFSCPPTKLGDLSRATYSNSESEALQYYAGCLRRWLTRWEQEILLRLIPASEQRQMFAEHLPDALLRADTASRYAAYGQGRQGGWLSVNDIRERENMSPVDGGDTYLEPLNMKPVGAAPAAPGPANTPMLPPQGRTAALLSAQRDVMVDSLARILRREIDKAQRAQSTSPKLRDHAQRYYADRVQQDHYLTAMRPAIRAWLAFVDSPEDADQVCQRLMSAHFERSKADLLTVADLYTEGVELQEALTSTVNAWDSTRAAQTIDHLIQHGVPPALPLPPTPAKPEHQMSVSLLKKWHRTKLV